MAEESNNPAVITGKIIEAMLNTQEMVPDPEKVAEAFQVIYDAVRDAGAYTDDDGGPMPMR